MGFFYHQESYPPVIKRVYTVHVIALPCWSSRSAGGLAPPRGGEAAFKGCRAPAAGGGGLAGGLALAARVGPAPHSPVAAGSRVTQTQPTPLPQLRALSLEGGSLEEGVRPAPTLTSGGGGKRSNATGSWQSGAGWGRVALLPAAAAFYTGALVTVRAKALPARQSFGWRNASLQQASELTLRFPSLRALLFRGLEHPPQRPYSASATQPATDTRPMAERRRRDQRGNPIPPLPQRTEPMKRGEEKGGVGVACGSVTSETRTWPLPGGGVP
ncbi:uncharacterized protein LOC122458273 [Dermochelys coriacea]|uniref:uncharacterized protein LOC122458273 n=1 Tax=Dermochelys coriacea TaxID=27794 RepID=UPI001CAA3E8B|nr:uncharacterized protein LOC122458273 [Dermochelys coriacea]